MLIIKGILLIFDLRGAEFALSVLTNRLLLDNKNACLKTFFRQAFGRKASV